MTSGGNNFNDFPRTNWPNFVYKVTFYSMGLFARTLQKGLSAFRLW